MRNRNGAALITVLWVMTLLMVIAVEFAHSMKTEINITRNLKEEMEAYFLAKAGINLAIAEIVQDTDYHHVNSDGEWMFGKQNTVKRKDILLGPGKLSYSIIDGESKLNINSVSKEALERFFEIIGGDAASAKDIIADSILDWIDEDDNLVRVNGAEDGYYMSLSTPYECKDAKFDTIDELLLVKGVTPAILYGNDKTWGIAEYITVRSSGINLNTASPIVLTALYGEEKANRIIQKRYENDGIYNKNSKSTYFTVIATGMILNSPIKSHIKARLKKITDGKTMGIEINYWDDNFKGNGVTFLKN